MDNDYILFDSNVNVYNIKINKIKENAEHNLNEGNNYKGDFNKFDYNLSNFDKNENYFTNFLVNPNYYSYMAKYYSEVPTNDTFIIYKKMNNNELKYVCTIENKPSENEVYTKFYDYNILNKQNYNYCVTKKYKSNNDIIYNYYSSTKENEWYEGEEYIIDKLDDTVELYIKPNFCKWFICDIEMTDDENIYFVKDDVWMFGIGANTGSITNNLNISKQDTLGRFSRVSIGEKDYESGTFTTLLGEMREFYDNSLYEKTHNPDLLNKLNKGYNFSKKYQYTEMDYKKYNFMNEKARIETINRTEMDKLVRWKSFIKNGSLKFMRDLKGNGWIIQIIDSPSYNIENTSFLQQTEVSFEWQEVIDASKVSIIKLER